MNLRKIHTSVLLCLLSLSPLACGGGTAAPESFDTAIVEESASFQLAEGSLVVTLDFGRVVSGFTASDIGIVSLESGL